MDNAADCDPPNYRGPRGAHGGWTGTGARYYWSPSRDFAFQCLSAQRRFLRHDEQGRMREDFGLKDLDRTVGLNYRPRVRSSVEGIRRG